LHSRVGARTLPAIAGALLRDPHSGEVWSAGYQPSGAEPDSYEAAFFEDRAEITRRDGTITTALKIVVSPEDDAEVRRVSISNLGNRLREIEVTSYAEVVLAPDAANAVHPAFSNLFVQTELLSELGAVLATWRRRSPAEPEISAAHLAVVEGEVVGGAQFETDRARFLGRGRGVRTPISVIDGRPLSNTAGTVLDPIFSLRRRIRIAPGATASIAFWTLVAPSRSEVLDLADKHHDPAAFERAVTLAWTHTQVQLFHLGIDPDEGNLFQRLASRVLYSSPALRPPSEVLSRSEGGPSALWAHGISGDLPIIVCRIDEIDDLEVARQLIRAHEYWRMKQLAVDLVILNERPASYFQDLQNGLEGLVRAYQSRSTAGGDPARGAVFILQAELVSAETRRLPTERSARCCSAAAGDSSGRSSVSRNPRRLVGRRRNARRPMQHRSPCRPGWRSSFSIALAASQRVGGNT
jgi:cyclic beta-1,2-glucan glucanotransferase